DQIIADILDGLFRIAVVHLFNIAGQRVRLYCGKILKRLIGSSSRQRIEFCAHLLDRNVSFRTRLFERLLTLTAIVEAIASEDLCRPYILRGDGTYFFGFHTVKELLKAAAI